MHTCHVELLQSVYCCSELHQRVCFPPIAESYGVCSKIGSGAVRSSFRVPVGSRRFAGLYGAVEHASVIRAFPGLPTNPIRNQPSLLRMPNSQEYASSNPGVPEPTESMSGLTARLGPRKSCRRSLTHLLDRCKPFDKPPALLAHHGPRSPASMSKDRAENLSASP